MATVQQHDKDDILFCAYTKMYKQIFARKLELQIHMQDPVTFGQNETRLSDF